MDIRFGVVASVIANVNRDPKRRSQPFTPDDFFPEPGINNKELPELTLDALKAELVARGVEIRSRGEIDGART